MKLFIILLSYIILYVKSNYQKHRFFGINDVDPIISKVSYQPIDHFDLTNTNKIPIRYFINNTVFKNVNSPLFVDLGGEGTQKPSALAGRFVINDYANKYQSLMVAIEHRMYGESIPEDGLTQNNLGYLSAIQAIEDFIHIIIDIKKEYNIKGPVIVIGGSYSGNLAVWIRQKYPNVVYAAIASSAPIYATTQFFEFMRVIDKDMGSKCSYAWKEAMETLEQRYNEKNTQDIKDKFNTCTLIQNDDDFSFFMYQIQSTFIYYPQYNGRYSLTVDEVCNMLTNITSSSYDNLAEFINYANNELTNPCTYSSYNKMVENLLNTNIESKGNIFASTRSWTWQVCSEYSYFQPIDPSLPFSQRINNDFYYKICLDVYNVSKKKVDRRVDHTNMFYGGFEPKTTNVAFTSGSVDPWNPLAKHETGYSDINCYASHIIGTAHCADIYAAKPSDSEELIQQRKETEIFIDELIQRVTKE